MANAADEARARAEEAKRKQEEAEKAKAEREKNPPAPEGEKSSEQAVKDGQAPATDAELLDPKSMLARLDAQERLIETLTAQQAGGTGPALTENKDISASGPGAQFDPRLVRTLPAGVSSAPSMQPMPAGNGGGSSGLAVADLGAAWGTDARGAPIQPRSYPGLEEEDVVVIAAGYHDDTIRNPGDIIRGYTGPAASWFVPKSLYDKVGPDEARRQMGRYITDHQSKRAA